MEIQIIFRPFLENKHGLAINAPQSAHCEAELNLMTWFIFSPDLPSMFELFQLI